MALIKDIYSTAFYDRFADRLQEVLPDFDKKEFIRRIFDEDFIRREWKDRMKHTTQVLHHFMPEDFSEAFLLIQQIIHRLREAHFGEDNLAFMFFPDYIETYGLEDYEISMEAFVFVTQFISCEFAVRPFLLKYGNQMIREMQDWSLHESRAVRRLASEGSRPRLPWAMAIPALKKDPSPLLPLLENLKQDPSESVRRSVANSLNDISKDHPEIVIGIAARWKGISKETDAIIKHGCRTLLKQGHPAILDHYGLQSANIGIADFEVITLQVKTGESMEFSFTITNQNEEAHTIRLEYGLYYKKAKGHLARKVFKISEKIYAPGETVAIRRKQSFKLITTRTFHPGMHQVSVIVNGEEKGLLDFELVG